MNFSKFSKTTSLRGFALLLGFLLIAANAYVQNVSGNISFLQPIIQKIEQTPEQDYIYLKTDRAFYQAGESIWWSAFLVSSPEQKPSSSRRILHIELLSQVDNRFETVMHKTVIANKGVASGEFTLPPQLAPGIYLIRAYTYWQLNNPKPPIFEKKIMICPNRRPAVAINLTFTQALYAKGETLRAWVVAKDSLNNPIPNCPLVCQLLKGSRVISSQNYPTDLSGNQFIQMQLPDTFETEPYILKIKVDSEPQTAFYFPVPLQPAKLKLQFFPETNRLVAGAENHIGFRAIAANSEPVNIEGILLDQTGAFITRLKTTANGIGSFRFTPSALQTYRVRITQPAEIQQEFPLPKTQEKGLVWEIKQGVANALSVRLFTSSAQTLGIILQIRGKVYYQQSLNAAIGENKFEIPLEGMPAGIGQVLLCDDKGNLLAQRWVCVNARKKLRIELDIPKKEFLPREKVDIKVRVTDEKGKPIEAALALSVGAEPLMNNQSNSPLSLSAWFLNCENKTDFPLNSLNLEDEAELKLFDLYLLTLPPDTRLSDNAPSNPPKFAAEKTVIAGRVIDYKTRKAITKGIIKVMPSNLTIKIEPDGSFYTDLPNLYQAQELIIDSKGYAATTYYLNEYTENLIIELGNENFGASLQNPRKSGGSTAPVNRLSPKDILQKYPPSPIEEFSPTPTLWQAMTYLWDNIELTYPQPQERRAPAASEDTIGFAANLPRPTPLNWQETLQKIIYPAECWKKKIQGRVVMRVKVNEKGKIESLTPLRTPHPLFTQAVQAACSTLIFKPATDSDGAPIATFIHLPFDFFISAIGEKENLVKGTRYSSPSFYPKLQHDSLLAHTQRFDNRRTLHWEGELQTDKNGRATFSFYLSDKIGKFLIAVEGLAINGLVGEKNVWIETRLPFEVNLELPTRAIIGDTIKVPIKFTNRTNLSLAGTLQLKFPSHWQTLTPPADTIRLLPNAKLKQRLKFVIQVPSRLQDTLFYTFGAWGYRWQGKQMLEPQLPGIINTIHYTTSSSQQAKLDFRGAAQQTSRLSWRLYPSLLAQAIGTAEALEAVPKANLDDWLSVHTIYNLLYLWLEKETTPLFALRKKIYQECQNSALAIKKYITPENHLVRWQNQAPDELVAARFLACWQESKWIRSLYEPTLKNELSKWLKSRLDSRGSFLGYYNLEERDALTALTLYWLKQADEKGYEKEIQLSLSKNAKIEEPYLLALLSFIQPNNKEIINKILSLQNPQKYWQGYSPTALGASGKQLAIEATALALLALAPAAATNEATLFSALEWLLEQRNSAGYWGSLHATAWVFRVCYQFQQKRQSAKQEINYALYFKNNIHYNQKITSDLPETLHLNTLPFCGKIIDFEQTLSNKKIPALATAQLIGEYVHPADTLIHIDTAQFRLNLTHLPADLKEGRSFSIGWDIKNVGYRPLPQLQFLWEVPPILSLSEIALEELVKNKIILGYLWQAPRLYLYLDRIAPGGQKKIEIVFKALQAGSATPKAFLFQYLYEPQSQISIGYPKIVILPGS
jgi:hypothetical protein